VIHQVPLKSAKPRRWAYFICLTTQMKSIQNRSSTDSDNKIMREKKLSVLYYFQAIQCHRSNQSQQSTHCHHMLWYHQLRQPGPQTMPIHIKKNPGYPDNARPIRTMYTWDLLNNCHIQITRNVLHHINSQLIVNSLASCASRVVFKQSQKNWQMFASEHQFTSWISRQCCMYNACIRGISLTIGT